MRLHGSAASHAHGASKPRRQARIQLILASELRLLDLAERDRRATTTLQIAARNGSRPHLANVSFHLEARLRVHQLAAFANWNERSRLLEC